MNIWETAVVNVQKGAKKVAAAAAIFSERVRVEIDIVRLQIRVNEVKARMDELHRTIGRKMVDLQKKGELPKATEQLLKDDDILSAIAELADREHELSDLNDEIKNGRAEIHAAAKHAEDSMP